MKTASGLTKDGIAVSNVYDKYQSRNPAVRWIMCAFKSALSELDAQVGPAFIHEVGCGKGCWVLKWQRKGIRAQGCGFSTRVIQLAQTNAASQGFASDLSRYAAFTIYKRGKMMPICSCVAMYWSTLSVPRQPCAL